VWSSLQKGKIRKQGFSLFSLTHHPLAVAEISVFIRLLKNAQMQGARNPEECGVLGRTLQRRRMRGTTQMGVFQQPLEKNRIRHS
jgi:hypothetical protein